jgi:hypothetical protein
VKIYANEEASFLSCHGSAFLPCTASAQSGADKSWNVYWTKFSLAIRKNNHVVLKQMMSKDFFNGGGYVEGDPRDDCLKSMNGSFLRSHRNSVARGTKRCGTNCRITTNDHLTFEYRNGRWLWTGVMGD